MKWFMAILAALVVIEAGFAACSGSAHAAAPANAEAAEPCHDASANSAMAGHGSSSAHGHAMAAAPVTDSSDVADPAHTADCCASGACADCALTPAMTCAAPDGADRIFGDRHGAPAPNTVLGRPLAHDPPPPRA
jgi:hypothetical protein